jgi:hypothetical protein
MLVKQVQRCIHYTHYKEAQNDAQSNDRTLCLKSEYIIWCRNGYANYVLSLTPATTTPIVPVTSTSGSTDVYISPPQKDDDAALISWNRKPCDDAKYPLLKNDADYQDWKLKIESQLIADTLLRVAEPTFKITTCRTGADTELAKLQVNYFEQILSAVLLNPVGKGLMITHQEDALFIWNEHDTHQLDFDYAQISTTALMT